MNSEKLDTAVHELFCDEAVKTSKSDTSAQASAEIPVEGIPIPVGIKGNNASFEDFRRKVCDEKNQRLSFRDDAAIAFENVDPTAVDAWRACVTTPSHASAGMSIRTLPPDGPNLLPGTPFVVVVSWLGSGNDPTIASVDVQGGATCSPFTAGTKLLEVSDNAFVCRRTAYDPIAILVHTDRGTISLSLKAATKPPGELPTLKIGDQDVEFSASYSVQNYEAIVFAGKGRIIVRDGGTLHVHTNRILSQNGAVARFVAIGRQGDVGPRGARCDSCDKGGVASSSSQQWDEWQRGCLAGNADRANYGKPGGRGGNGDGADVIIHVRQIQGSFECITEDGPAGPGGARGPGRQICDQECEPHHRLDYCHPDNDQYGQGAPGEKGVSHCTVLPPEAM